MLPYINRIAGGVVLLAGLYVTYYAYWEIRLLHGDTVPEGPVAWISEWTARTTQRVDDWGVSAFAVALIALLVASLARRFRTRHNEQSTQPTSVDPEPANITRITVTTGEPR